MANQMDALSEGVKQCFDCKLHSWNNMQAELWNKTTGINGFQVKKSFPIFLFVYHGLFPSRWAPWGLKKN